MQVSFFFNKYFEINCYIFFIVKFFHNCITRGISRRANVKTSIGFLFIESTLSDLRCDVHDIKNQLAELNAIYFQTTDGQIVNLIHFVFSQTRAHRQPFMYIHPKGKELKRIFINCIWRQGRGLFTVLRLRLRSYFLPRLTG